MSYSLLAHMYYSVYYRTALYDANSPYLILKVMQIKDIYTCTIPLFNLIAIVLVIIIENRQIEVLTISNYTCA